MTFTLTAQAINDHDIVFAEALGYTTHPSPDGHVPTIWWLPRDDAFAWISATNEVLINEIDGPEDEHGMRTAQLALDRETIRFKQIRRPMPDGWETAEVLTMHGDLRIIAIRKGA